MNIVGKKWCLLSREFPGRTDISLKSRYSFLQRKKQKDREKVVTNPKETETQDFTLFYDDDCESFPLFNWSELQEFDC